MRRLRMIGRLAVLWLIPSLVPAVALAQNTGIAGVVKDTSGAVMPGVTVEASSPALIEKVRTVVTDAQGLYSIVDLRPGTYAVTFTLAGFTTVRREGIELTGSFTATVNADLQVGAVNETLTVTGQAPVVDTRNVVQLNVMDDNTREALPTGRSVLYIATLIPGTTRTTTVGRLHDLAGTSDSRGASMIHGGRSQDYMLQYDGSNTDLAGGGSGQSWQTNPGEIQEFVYELGALSAESAFGGVRANIIPKEGGNRYVGSFFYAFSGDRFQSNNLSSELEGLGVLQPVSLKKHWDANVSGGGPILRDKLWFFSSYRNQGNDEGVVGMFEAIDPRSFVFDPAKGAAGNVDVNRPAIYLARNYYYSSRFTWQATPKNKFALYLSSQPRHNYNFRTSGTVSAESSSNQEFGNQVWGASPTCGRPENSGLFERTREHRDSPGCGPLVLHQGSWKSTITSKLLFESVYAFNDDWGCRCVPFGDLGHLYAGPDVVAVVDTGSGYTYRSSAATYDYGDWRHDSAKLALSYVTGAHAAKFGFMWDWGFNELIDSFHNQNMTFQFQNGVPNRITVYNEPWTDWNGWRKMGFFAQDQWTFRRATINAGVRFDLHNGFTGDNQTTGPNAYAPFQRWSKIENVPNWKDVSPRFGIAYDLFGDGRTALKYTLSRYVVNDGTGFPASVNPLRFNMSATRSWDDRTPKEGGIPNDFIPQEAELGTLSNTAFATAATTTTVDDAIREGWGVRQYDWETSVSMQHQLLPELGVNFGFTRRWFKNFTVTDNRAVGPSDYDEFCVTAPTDDRLGSVSGSRICGLYDITSAARSRRPDNLQTSSDNFGTQKEFYQGIDLNLNLRMRGVTLQGGLNSGTAGNSTEACFVIDSPTQRFCKVDRPWRHNLRFLGSVELPYGFNAGATFIADPGGEILATYGLTNADITAGRVQFVNPARTTFAGGSSSVQLLAPGTKFQKTLYQVDIRVSKTFDIQRFRARFTLDLANLTNASNVFTQNNSYGSSWLRPTYVMPGRLIKPGFQIEF